MLTPFKVPFEAELQRLSEQCDQLIEQADRDYRFNAGLRKRLNDEASAFMMVAKRYPLIQLSSYQVDDNWLQCALRVIGRTRYFIDRYQRQQGTQVRDHFAQLYDLKHHLLTALCLVQIPPGFSWEAGLSTDTHNCISVLLLHPDQPIWRMHLHWPCRHVPSAVSTVLRARYGHWPLRHTL